MTAIDSDLVITYGSLTLGGSSAYRPSAANGKWRLRLGYETSSFECRVVFSATTHAGLKSLEDALIAAFRRPRQDFTLTCNGQTIASWSHANNTGVNARPEAEKSGSPADTGLSREYTIRVEVDMPADLSGVAGRRQASIDVAYSPSRRRTVSIQGVYTALSSNTARAQYEAQITAFASSALAAVDAGATWELVGEPSTPSDDQGKSLTFTRTYKERIYNQSSAGKDHAAIIDSSLRFSRAIEAPGDADLGGNPRRLIRVTATYSCSVDKTVTTDLKGLYDATIRPFIINQAKQTFGGGSFAMVGEAPDFDPEENRVSASLSMHFRGASDLISQSYTRETRFRYGSELVPVRNGNRLAKMAFDGADSIEQTTTITKQRIAPGAGRSLSSGGGGGGGGGLSLVGQHPMGSFSGPAGTGGSIGGGGGLGGGIPLVGQHSMGSFDGPAGTGGSIGGGGSANKSPDGSAPTAAGLPDLTAGLASRKMEDRISEQPSRLGTPEYGLDTIIETHVLTYEFFVQVLPGAAPSGGSDLSNTGGGGESTVVGGR